LGRLVGWKTCRHLLRNREARWYRFFLFALNTFHHSSQRPFATQGQDIDMATLQYPVLGSPLATTGDVWIESPLSVPLTRLSTCTALLSHQHAVYVHQLTNWLRNAWLASWVIYAANLTTLSMIIIINRFDPVDPTSLPLVYSIYHTFGGQQETHVVDKTYQARLVQDQPAPYSFSNPPSKRIEHHLVSDTQESLSSPSIVHLHSSFPPAVRTRLT
jgi:hypothetical protein